MRNTSQNYTIMSQLYNYRCKSVAMENQGMTSKVAPEWVTSLLCKQFMEYY